MLSAFKNFLVTFLVAALVFGSVAYFVTRFLTDTISGIFDAESSELDSILNPPPDTSGEDVTTDTAQDPDTSEEPEINILGESFNMVLIVTDYQPDIFSDYLPTTSELNARYDAGEDSFGVLSKEYRRIRASSVLLFRADKERREFTITAFPSSTRVNTASGIQSMENLYNLYGADYIVSKISAMTGLEIDYSLLVNVTELSEIVSNLGGISMYLSHDVYYNGQVSSTQKPTDDMAATMPLLYKIGRNTIDGPGSVVILMLEENECGVAARNTLLVSMFTGIMDVLTAYPDTDIRSFYANLYDNALIDSSMTVDDLVAVVDLVRAWNSEFFTKKTIDYPGRTVAATEEAGAYYAPDIQAGVKLFENYRKTVVQSKN